MLQVSDSQFEEFIAQAMDELSEQFLEHANNVAVVWSEEPTDEQRVKLKLRCNETLFGLYEGTPLTRRGDNYSLVLPDKITIFKNPIVSACSNDNEVKAQVKHTLWHELGHHYGLDHDRIHEIERSWQ